MDFADFFAAGLETITRLRSAVSTFWGLFVRFGRWGCGCSEGEWRQQHGKEQIG